MNVIIPNIGRRGYLVDYIKNIETFDGKVYVSDCDSTASGLYGNNDGHYILSRPVDDEKLYVESLRKLCLELDVSLVIPVIDPEIYILSKYRDFFFEEGIQVLVSEKSVLDICYNKLKMNEFLDKEGFLYPKTYNNLEDFLSDFDSKKIEFPVLVKPIYGSGSVETYVVNHKDELVTRFHDGLLIQQFVLGEEYGIDVFNTMDKKPVRCVVKKKISMRSGETDKSLTVKNEDIQNEVIRLARRLGHIGNLDCDILMCKDKMYFIDLNPRFGGGYPATHAAGVNLLSLVIDMIEKKKIVEDFNNYQENLLVMKEISVRTVRLEKEI